MRLIHKSFLMGTGGRPSKIHGIGFIFVPSDKILKHLPDAVKYYTLCGIGWWSYDSSLQVEVMQRPGKVDCKRCRATRRYREQAGRRVTE